MNSITRRNFFLGTVAASAASAADAHDAFFLPNRGQFSEGGAFCADLPRWRGVFSPGSASFRAKRLVGDPGPFGVSASRPSPTVNLHLALPGAATHDPVGEDRRAGRSDFYFHGDPETFVRNLPHFYRLRYRAVWPGVDLLVRVWERGAELTPVLADAAAAERLAFHWRGASPAKFGTGVALSAPWGTVRQRTPTLAGGGTVRGAYRLDSQGVVRFV